MARILLVDDDLVYLDELAMGLQGLDHEVTTASSGGEGLALLQSLEFDIAICDVVMSGGGALSFLHEIRSADSEFPVIIITGRSAIATSPVFTEGMHQADAKIQKSASLAEIDRLVRSLVA
ncbi:response regulator [Gymnodinialimonas sp. 2305UL16-5]|uniref:response regulator n=1 Tax=Gymnodinialimonas mytili TaxID=3126503 RepID=UPI0030B74EF2